MKQWAVGGDEERTQWKKWEEDGMRGSRKQRAKRVTVAVGVHEWVFSLFNKINYFTLSLSKKCTLFLKNTHPYQIPNYVFQF